MTNVVTLTDQTFEEEVLKSDLPVLVDFWAPWCGPCRMMAPVLDALSVELSGRVKIAKLDVENPSHQALAAQYAIQSIPNMKLFKKGAIAHEFIGFRPAEMFKKELEAAL